MSTHNEEDLRCHHGMWWKYPLTNHGESDNHQEGLYTRTFGGEKGKNFSVEIVRRLIEAEPHWKRAFVG